jgi:hypothetical protein
MGWSRDLIGSSPFGRSGRSLHVNQKMPACDWLSGPAGPLIGWRASCSRAAQLPQLQPSCCHWTSLQHSCYSSCASSDHSCRPPVHHAGRWRPSRSLIGCLPTKPAWRSHVQVSSAAARRPSRTARRLPVVAENK